MKEKRVSNKVKQKFISFNTDNLKLGFFKNRQRIWKIN
jgi:hypothetical protein